MLRVGLLTLNTFLLVACGFVLATSARTLLRPTTPAGFELPQPRADSDGQRSFDRYAALASRDLFHLPPTVGPAPPPPEEELAESKLKVRLIGTVAATDPALSLAAVEDLGSKDRLVVRAEDDLSGARVVRIERKRIVVENHGRLEVVTLDEEDQPNSASRAPVGDRARGSARSRPKRPSISNRVRELSRRAAESPRPARSRVQSVLTQARIVPRYGEEGQLTGLELSAIKPDSLLETAGFKNGDLVVSVNDTEISDPAQGLKSFRSLGDQAGFVVEVEREDEIVELEYTPEE